jgi:DNA-binding GntR family transcriptional regulator
METGMPDTRHTQAIKVAAELRAKIVSGDLRAGSPLPDMPTLTAEYGVSVQ